MVIIHFLPFTTVSVIHSESMPSKLTKTPKEELKPFLTNLGTHMRANFAYLVNKFREWDIDLSKIIIAAPFNKIGFQMSPSRIECEKALQVPECDVIAISILAAGYLELPEAVEYIGGLSNIKGVVVGVLKERHACETFRFLQKKLKGSAVL